MARVSEPPHLLRQRQLARLVGARPSPGGPDGVRRGQQLEGLPGDRRGSQPGQRRRGDPPRRRLHRDLPAQPGCSLERRHAHHQHRRVVHVAGRARHRRLAQRHRLRPHHRRGPQRSAHRGHHVLRALRTLAPALRRAPPGPRLRRPDRDIRLLERLNPDLGRAVAPGVLEPGAAHPRSQRELLGRRPDAAGRPGGDGPQGGHRHRGRGPADRRGHGRLPPALPRRQAASRTAVGVSCPGRASSWRASGSIRPRPTGASR